MGLNVKGLRPRDNPRPRNIPKDLDRKLARTLNQRQPKSSVIAAAGVDQAAGPGQIEIPTTINVSGKSFSIMQGEVTVGLFNWFVDAGYKITGHNADTLQELLGGAPSKYLTYLSLLDGEALAKALSEQTGKTWRIPTEDEWLAAIKLVRNKLLGENWEWTTSEFGSPSGCRLPYLNGLESLRFAYRDTHNPEGRYVRSAVRLVEDKK